MKFCKGYEEKLSDYVDGALPHNLKKEVESHFASCKSCADLFSAIKNVREQLKRLHSIKTSPDFDTVLRARIRLERSLSRRSLFTRPIGIPVYAATGALIVLAAFFVFGPISAEFNPSGSQSAAVGNANGIGQNVAYPMNSGQMLQGGQVHFPMDQLILPTTGTPLNSQEARRYIRMRADSLRDQSLQQVSQSFEF